MLAKVDAFFVGKKTYIFSVAGVVVLVAVYQGYLDTELGNQLLVLFGFGGIAALRAAK